MASAGNRFARLLADIADAQLDATDSEQVASDVPSADGGAGKAPTAEFHLSLAMRAASERARQLVFRTNTPYLPTAETTQAIAQHATRREDLAVERRAQFEDQARRIALTMRRPRAVASPRLTLAYDQVGPMTPGVLDRTG